VHRQAAPPTLPALRPRLERRIDNLQIPPEMTEARSLRDEVAAALARRPDGEAVCHGDLHPLRLRSSAKEVVTAWLPVVAAARIVRTPASSRVCLR
jgi:hypothetical protein